ncbi:MAG: Spy/CpxP family protein refolding chaperone [Desulfuromonadales bacterium]|nr:Spy/CpxP family protein refolding chaperone [Desulfuromonadales bacterium]
MSVKYKSTATIAVMLCIAALSAFAGIAQANGGEWGDGVGSTQHRNNFRWLEKELTLTDVQKAQAKKIFKANRAVVKPIIENMRAEQIKLRALMHADTIDEAAIRLETDKIAGILAGLNVNRAKVEAQFRAILMPSQLVTLKTLHQKHQNATSATAPAE